MDVIPCQLISPVSETIVRSVDSEILFSQGTISTPLDEMVVQISGENDTENGIVDRQCQVYVKSKGRQCLRMAMRNDIYFYAHCSIKKEKCVKVITPICGGTAIGGSRCKNHSGSDGSNQVSLPVGSKRPKLKVHCAYTHSRQEGTVEVPMVTEFPSQLISPVSETVVQSVDSEILFNKGTISRPLDETVVQVSVEQDAKDGIVERRCQAYVKSMGRQCSRCKNHSLPNLSFCKKHLPNAHINKSSNSNCSTLKRKFEEICIGFSKIRICNDSVLAHSRIPLEIDTKSVIEDEDESFCLFRSYACALCFESFTNMKLLGSHVQKEHPVNYGEHLFLLKCIPCGDQFGTMEKLWLHVKSVHPAELKLSKYSLSKESNI
ncbi:putative histone-lysine N-methyltransferase transcription factor C2H2 family [Medicago truncatula]|uniref:Putative histone-lysine N-methyltransferase transcription factor C2H2 family n=1 Tax=Medicago truncatula TaxID=3880 RepID=A0A396IHE9_MEDTR|nr:putative histone-lysine N-methyltransferase transcription factor C2H2 family [Medicago truncatula]